MAVCYVLFYSWRYNSSYTLIFFQFLNTSPHEEDMIDTILQSEHKHDSVKLHNTAVIFFSPLEERGGERGVLWRNWSILSSPFRPAGFKRIHGQKRRKRGQRWISGDRPVSSTRSKNVQTGRLESHRWPDTHRRSIMKLWRRQRLLGVCCQELGLRCWCEDTVCVCVVVKGCVFVSARILNLSLLNMKETSW